MRNIVIPLGTGYFLDDAVHKAPIIDNLSSEFDVGVVSRLNPSEICGWNDVGGIIGRSMQQDLEEALAKITKSSHDMTYIYNSERFSERPSIDRISDIENWLGVPLRYIGSLDRRFYDSRRDVDSRPTNLLGMYITTLIEFFRDYFTVHETDAMMNSLEDDVFSVTSYYVAKKMGIKVVGLMGGRFPEKGIMLSEGFSNVHMWSNRNSELEEVRALYKEDALAGKEIRELQARKVDVLSSTQFAVNFRRLINYNGYRKRIVTAHPYEDFILEPVRIGAIIDYAHRFVKKHIAGRLMTCKPSLQEDYFFFPLHYTEDAQITFREPFLNQIRLVASIARSMPINHLLYVKPHPHYFCTDIGLNELRRLSKIENLRIVNPDISPGELIRNAKCVITINSTSGFEAMVLGTPVITFGHDFYCNEKVADVIRDLNELPASIMRIGLKSDAARDYNITEFVRNIYSNTIWIENIPYEWGTFGMTSEDGRKIALAFGAIENEKHANSDEGNT